MLVNCNAILIITLLYFHSFLYLYFWVYRTINGFEISRPSFTKCNKYSRKSKYTIYNYDKDKYIYREQDNNKKLQRKQQNIQIQNVCIYWTNHHCFPINVGKYEKSSKLFKVSFLSTTSASPSRFILREDVSASGHWELSPAAGGRLNRHRRRLLVISVIVRRGFSDVRMLVLIALSLYKHKLLRF